MPLDVLSKIQNFANGGTVDAGTRGQINQMLGMAQQNSTMQSGLEGIASALSNKGADINPETVAKIAKAGQAFAKAMEQANLAMLGIHGSFSNIDIKPLQQAEASVSNIAESGKSIVIGISTDKALDSLKRVSDEVRKLRTHSTVDVSMGASPAHAAGRKNNFATGGRVTFHRQNTETAQSGGIFQRGTSIGDKNMIFANKGEGILTEKAVRMGAQQRGMSPESYIRALNNPSVNLSSVKRGRSFSYGGLLMSTAAHDPNSRNAPNLDMNAIDDFNKLMDYLRSKSFHGSQNVPVSLDPNGKTLQDYFDENFVMTRRFLDESRIRQLLDEAKRLEKEYEDDVARKMGKLKTANSPDVLTTVPSTSPNFYSVPSATAAAKNANMLINGDENMLSPANISKESMKSLKSTSRSASKMGGVVVSGLGEEAKTTFEGMKTMQIAESAKEISSVFQSSTEEQLQYLLAYFENQFPGFGADKIIELLEQVNSDITSVTDEQAKKLDSIRTFFNLTDIETLKERIDESMETQMNDIEKAIEQGINNGSLKGNKMSIKATELLKVITDAEKYNTSYTKEEKKRLHALGKLFSTAKSNESVASVIAGLIPTKKDSLKTKSGSHINSLKTLLTAIRSGDFDTSSGEEFTRAIERMTPFIDANEEKIESLGDALNKMFKTTDRDVKHELEQIPLIGKAFEGNVVGTMAYVAAIAYLAKKIDKMMKQIYEFVGEQAKVSKNFTIASQSLKAFTDGSADLDGMRRSLNMTREQAGQLAGMLNEVALKGVHSIETVHAIASNLKTALGEVDLTLLKEAVTLINDLPKEQVNVLINGIGTFDDKANLIANLMNDGNLDKTINLMMNGAFGDVEGSAQLSERDKAIIEAQNEANKLLEDIKQGLYSWIPRGISSSAVFYAKVIGSVSKTVASGAVLYKISKDIKTIIEKVDERNGNIKQKTQNVLPPLDIKKEIADAKGVFTKVFVDPAKKMRHPIDNLKGLFSKKTLQAAGGGGGTGTGAKALEFLGRNSKVFGGIMATALPALAAKGMTSLYERQLRNASEKRVSAYRKERQTNLDTYGNTIGYKGLSMRMGAEERGAKAAMTTAKVLGTLSTTILGASAAMGAFTLGVGTAVGAIAAGVIALGAFTADMIGKRSLSNESAFTHQEKGLWGFKTVADEDAKQRMEFYRDTLSYLDKVAKANGGKSRDDMLKELVALNKHVKAIEMIEKSRFTAFDENNFASDLDLLKQFKTVGGTNAAFASTKNRMFNENMRGYAMQANALAYQKNSIMNNPNLGTEARANALNRVIQAETKMHEKFIGNMVQVINSLGETPTIIASNLKQQLNEAFNGFLSKSFVNNVYMSRENARGDMAATAANLETLFKDYQASNNNIANAMATVESLLSRAQREAAGRQSNTGLTDEQAERNVNEVQKKLMQSAGEVASISSSLEIINEIVTKASDELNMNRNGEIDDSIAYEFRSKAAIMLEQLKNVLEHEELNGRGEGGLAQETRAFIEKFEQTQKNIEKMKDNKDVVAEFASLYTLPSELKATISKLEEAMGGLTDEDRTRMRQGREHLMDKKTIDSLKDMLVANQNMYTTNGKKYIEELERQAGKFVSSMNTVLNNGAVQFARAIRDALEKAEEFDLFGGAAVAFDNIDEAISELAESSQALVDARRLADQNLNFDDVTKMAQDFFDDYDREVEKGMGNPAEWAILETVEDIFKKMCENDENAITEEQARADKDADRRFGEILRSMAGGFNGKFNKNTANFFGFKDAEEMDEISADELGRRFRENEEKAIQDIQNMFQGISREDARAKMAERFGWNSDANYSDVNSKRFLEVLGKANEQRNRNAETAKRKRAELEQSKPDRRRKAEEEYRGKFETAQEQLMRKARDSESGRKYIEMSLKEATAQSRMMMNPHDRKAREDYERAKNEKEAFESLLNSNQEYYEKQKRILEDMERNGAGKGEIDAQRLTLNQASLLDKLDGDVMKAVQGFQGVMATKLQAGMELMKADAEWRARFMQVFNGIPKVLDKIVMSGRNLMLLSRQGALESRQSYMNRYGDVGRAVSMTGNSMWNAGRLLQSQMATVENSDTIKKLKEENARIIAEAARRDGMTEEKLANLRKSLDNKVIQAKYDAEMKLKDNYIQSLQKAVESAIGAIERSTEGLNIQKDLFETIGAPFEYILDIEQELVRNAKANAEVQERVLAEMIDNGITGAALEEQKLKTAKASAEVIKASFGAQRDSLDKLLGKMMGTFEQIGGIFGPDSDFMKARKAGQGYTQLPSGMISASGGTVTDYADRVMGLQNAAGMAYGVKMRRGEAEIFDYGERIPTFGGGRMQGNIRPRNERTQMGTSERGIANGAGIGELQRRALSLYGFAEKTGMRGMSKRQIAQASAINDEIASRKLENLSTDNLSEAEKSNSLLTEIRNSVNDIKSGNMAGNRGGVVPGSPTASRPAMTTTAELRNPALGGFQRQMTRAWTLPQSRGYGRNRKRNPLFWHEEPTPSNPALANPALFYASKTNKQSRPAYTAEESVKRIEDRIAANEKLNEKMVEFYGEMGLDPKEAYAIIGEQEQDLEKRKALSAKNYEESVASAKARREQEKKDNEAYYQAELDAKNSMSEDERRRVEDRFIDDEYDRKIAQIEENAKRQAKQVEFARLNSPLSTPARPAGVAVQRGVGATGTTQQAPVQNESVFINTGNRAMNAAIHALSRDEALSHRRESNVERPSAGKQDSDEKGSKDSNVNVQVKITMDSSLFKAEVVKIARENLTAIMNKPGQK